MALPDFDTSEDGIRNLHKNILSRYPNALIQWPHNDKVCPGYPPHLVQEHCVKDAEWQAIRRSMKGVPTHEKLATLKAWWDKQMALADEQEEPAKGFKQVIVFTVVCVQVGNYLGALRRGGQLDSQNRIRKYI